VVVSVPVLPSVVVCVRRFFVIHSMEFAELKSTLL